MISEQQTRQQKIDLQLGRAGWAVGSRRVVEEFLVENPSGVGEPAASYRTKQEFADYVLLDHLDRPIAVVEAQKESGNHTR